MHEMTHYVVATFVNGVRVGVGPCLTIFCESGNTNIGHLNA